jgi:hypothetical protein
MRDDELRQPEGRVVAPRLLARVEHRPTHHQRADGLVGFGGHLRGDVSLD